MLHLSQGFFNNLKVGRDSLTQIMTQVKGGYKEQTGGI